MIRLSLCAAAVLALLLSLALPKPLPNEETIQALLAPYADSTSILPSIFREEFSRKSDSEVIRLAMHPDVRISIPAKWEEVRRSAQPDSKSSVEMQLAEFGGFLDGRILCTTPQWWKDEIVNGYGKGFVAVKLNERFQIMKRETELGSQIFVRKNDASVSFDNIDELEIAGTINDLSFSIPNNFDEKEDGLSLVDNAFGIDAIKINDQSILVGFVQSGVLFVTLAERASGRVYWKKRFLGMESTMGTTGPVSLFESIEIMDTGDSNNVCLFVRHTLQISLYVVAVGDGDCTLHFCTALARIPTPEK